jgi:hypothetical protein
MINQEDLSTLEDITQEVIFGEENNNVELIPENPKSLLVSETNLRFSAADWFESMQTRDITIAGLGGIGSWVAVLVGKLTPHYIYVHDADSVEPVNIAGQLYSVSQYTRGKAVETASNIRAFCSFYNVEARTSNLGRYNRCSKILICGFDSMRSRKEAFISWLNEVSISQDKSKCLFIDGRLAAEEFQIFCIAGDDEYHKKLYKKEWLFSDSEAEATVCSYKQTAYCASMIASYMTNLLVNFVSNTANDEPTLFPRELPFKTIYDARLMLFKTE